MRISDWSSDVCSSDLFARQNHGLRRLWAVDEDDALLRSRRGNIEILPALHVARHAPKTEALLEQRLQFRQARIADRKDLRIVGPNPAMMERRKIVASKLLNDSRVAGSCEGYAVGMLLTEKKRRRSEEHTSELQSLMDK